MLLLNQIVTFGKLDKVFVQRPPDNGNNLAILSKTDIQSQLSNKFKQITNQFNAEKIKERLLSPEQIEDDSEEEYETQEIYTAENRCRNNNDLQKTVLNQQTFAAQSPSTSRLEQQLINMRSIIE